MKEYIERALAVQELEVLRQEYEMHDDCDELVAKRCRDALSAVPAADVAEVVRCRECIYRDGTPGQPNILCAQMHDDDFCSYGQRKEAAHD